VEFGVEIGEYRGVVGCRGACSNAYCRSGPPPSRRRSLNLCRACFKSITEEKPRRCQLTDSGEYGKERVELAGGLQLATLAVVPVRRADG
jgi:hypothetical protein